MFIPYSFNEITNPLPRWVTLGVSDPESSSPKSRIATMFGIATSRFAAI